MNNCDSLSGLFTPTIIKVTTIVWTIVFVEYCTGRLLHNRLYTLFCDCDCDSYSMHRKILVVNVIAIIIVQIMVGLHIFVLLYTFTLEARM